MTGRKLRGVTLVEVIMVSAIIAVVAIPILGLTIQGAQLFTRTSSSIEPQHSVVMALKRMEKDIREAMVVNMKDDSYANPTIVEVIMPQKDTATGLNKIVDNKLVAGKHVCFFLGDSLVLLGKTYAYPSATGDTIYRLESDTQILPLSSWYTGSKVTEVINGVRSVPRVIDPASGKEVNGQIFQYSPVDDNDTPDDPLDDLLLPNTNLITITLTVPIVDSSKGNQVTVNHTLATKFCLRNMETALPTN